MPQPTSRPILDPYRSMGCFTSGPLTSSANSITTPTAHSFKVYSPTLAINVQSPPLPHPITATSSHNQMTYLRTKHRVVKMKYHHVVGQWEVTSPEHDTSIATLLLFEGIVIMAEQKQITVIDEISGEVMIRVLPFTCQGMVHPVSYVNKVLLWGKGNLSLVNPLSEKVLYQFPKTLSLIAEQETNIVSLATSSLVDIVAIGLQNGQILFLNLKKDTVVFSLRQKSPPTSIAFSPDAPAMATGDSSGHVILWDLKHKKISYKMEYCVAGAIDSLLFMAGLEGVLTVGSSQANVIRQLRINFQDNKILTLLRERVGNSQQLTQVKIGSNNDLVLCNTVETMWLSFHSQCNNYLIGGTLDSKPPYHLQTRHYTVELLDKQTPKSVYKIGQHAVVGRITISRRYCVVASIRRMVKLGMSYELEWPVSAISQILLQNEHYIYAITPFQIVVCDFDTSTIVQTIERQGVVKAVENHYNNMMAFGAEGSSKIELWDMVRIAQGRVFTPPAPIPSQPPLCISFTPDNRFLLSSHSTSHSLLIWDIPNYSLYKTFHLSFPLISHTFTPDNQFMVSLFQGGREVNVWNNYLGRVATSRQLEQLSFSPEIKVRIGDGRLHGNQSVVKVEKTDSDGENQEEDDIFASIPEADDGVQEYSFAKIGQWMPLIHYDEIRERNTPTTNKPNASSLPFFLDFRNLTQQKQRMREEARQQAVQARARASQQQDKHFKAQKNNQIHLDETSGDEECQEALKKLAALSVGQVDYQLRSFLLRPGNAQLLIRMLSAGWKQCSAVQQQIKNIILHRAISLIGIDLVESPEDDSGMAKECRRLLEVIDDETKSMKERLSKCIVVAQRQSPNLTS